MAAYIIVNVEVVNPELYAEYAKIVGVSVAQYGGRFIVRGGQAERLEGSVEPRRVVVLEFPSVERAEAFYKSPEYVAARKVRAGAAQAQFVVVEGIE